MIELPPVVRAKAAAVGATGWVDTVPTLVADLEHDWDVQVGRVYPDATEALVAEARTADGADAVLKVHIPRDGGRHARDEIAVLRRTDGDGCVRLLRDDPDRLALLLERLGPSIADLDLPVARRHEILADLATRVWRPAPDLPLHTGAQKARWLGEYVVALWDDVGRPCTEAAIAHAVGCAARREAAHDDERAVLLHGDVHQWNALRHGNGFALVDPDGLLAEPEYDLGVIMREDPVELMAGDPTERARMLAARTGRDATAIWEWGVLERVSTGLLATSIGLQPVGGEMLAAADELALLRPEV